MSCPSPYSSSCSRPNLQEESKSRGEFDLSKTSNYFEEIYFKKTVARQWPKQATFPAYFPKGCHLWKEIIQITVNIPLVSIRGKKQTQTSNTTENINWSVLTFNRWEKFPVSSAENLHPACHGVQQLITVLIPGVGAGWGERSWRVTRLKIQVCKYWHASLRG